MPAPGWLQRLVANALEEDLGHGDVTSAVCIPGTAWAAGDLLAKGSGVLAGVAAAQEVARQVDDRVSLAWHAADGQAFTAGTVIARVDGPARSVLAFERTALNFLQQLSGVATLTRAFVERVAGTGAAIVDTRKTVPGLRSLQKAAVVAGGGRNHRFGLFDAILIKDNHLQVAGGVEEALRAARDGAPFMAKVEIEVTTPQDAELAATLGADVIMLDNMTPEQVAESLARVGKRARTEVSGGVSLDTVRAYAELGVDFISVGKLTHSAPAVDLSLEITEFRTLP
jgi:nicotinate-nucleotide pyrophosphorylase (carboxylating)